MSMNIHIYAEREITVNKTGKTDTQTVNFDVWQTPTDVSYAIINADDPMHAYKEWVLGVSIDEEIEIFEENDIFCEGAPIGVEIHNGGKIHIENLNKLIEEATEDGYEVKFKVW